MAWQRSVRNAELSATDKGIRYELRMYVYPDGRGNIEGKGLDFPVNDAEEATTAFASLWRRARLEGAKNQRNKAAGKPT